MHKRFNWLFVGSERGGHTAAVLYTLVATCKRLRIDPFAYLRDVFDRLPKNTSDEALRDLLPDRWVEQNPKHRLAHRVIEDDQAKERRRKRNRQLTKANAKKLIKPNEFEPGPQRSGFFHARRSPSRQTRAAAPLL